MYWRWLERRAAPAPGYKAFTKEFDREVEGGRLDEVLGPMPDKMRQGWSEAVAAFEGALLGWRTRATLRGMEIEGEIRSALGKEETADSVVTLLIDHSGSMRGRKMLLAAAAAEVALGFAEGLGCKVKVLGFTTVSWRGGQSRQSWQRRGMRSRPGRLCDLLHIRWVEAGAQKGFRWYGPMLRPDLPKENLDGEALEWAEERLLDRPERGKVLIVLSDGAPVDDSTLSANGPSYLWDHAQEVVRRIEAEGRIRLGAVRIGYDRGGPFSATRDIRNADDLGTALLDLLRELLIKRRGGGSSEAPAAPTRS